MQHVADTFDFIALAPGSPTDTAIAAAASRAGAIGVLDLSYATRNRPADAAKRFCGWRATDAA